MNDKHRTAAAPAPGMTLGDILYVLFRHKGKIVLCAILGIAGAAALPFVMPPEYQSEAKLYVSYVTDTKAPTSVGETIQSTTAGESVINTELEILKSRDLAQQVAQDLGPDKILHGKINASTDPLIAAAGLIQKGLVAQMVPNASVIRLSFHHPNPAVVQPVLNRLTSFYFIKHNEIHSPEAIDEFLTKETDLLRSRLQATQEALRKAKAQVGVVALEDDKKTYTSQLSKIRERIMDAEAELASRQAEVAAMAGLFPTNTPAPIEPSVTTHLVNATNLVAAPPSTITRYRGICGLLQNLRAKEQNLLIQFTPENSFVREIQSQIAANDKIRLQLEADYPSLVAVNTFENRATGAEPVAGTRGDVIAARAGVAALEAKIRTLNGQLAKIDSKAVAVDAAEDSIMDLERKKEFDETYYKHFLEKLAQVQLDKKASAEQVSIRPVQLPSPPAPAPSKLHKMMAGVLFGGVAAGVALAFLLELYVDQSYRRPSEIEKSLSLPLFVSIPWVKFNGHSRRRLAKGSRTKTLQEKVASSDGSNNGAPNTAGGSLEKAPNGDSSSHALEVAPWDSKHALRPFSDGLRDRLITYFEINNLTHKPKLVSVTSCHGGSGVSTVAAGLAASLSETGEGNVLLVDMNVQNGAAHHFYKGDLACGIDDALEKQKRDGALVQDNLYVVSESRNKDKLPAVLPLRFKNLVPRLKASDFDYIIFDMPPISQVSITPRLAKFMDMVLLVVESEKTSRAAVKRASSFLSETRTNVGLVLNKGRSYVPKGLNQEDQEG